MLRIKTMPANVVSSLSPSEKVRGPLTTFEKISRAANLRFAMIEAFLKNHLKIAETIHNSHSGTYYDYSASNVVISLFGGIVYAIPRIVRLIFGWSSTAVEKALYLKDMPLLENLLDNGASLDSHQKVLYLLEEVVAGADNDSKDIALRIISKLDDKMRSFRVTSQHGEPVDVPGEYEIVDSEEIVDPTPSSMGGGATCTRHRYSQRQTAKYVNKSLYHYARDLLKIEDDDLKKAGIISKGVSSEADAREFSEDLYRTYYS